MGFRRAPDNLRSDDTVEILLALGEGPWKGLVNGMQSLEFDNTPIQNADLTMNFPGASYNLELGYPNPSPITMDLGGIANNNPTGNQPLAQNIAQNKSTSSVLTQPEYIDLRFVVAQLVTETNNGVGEASARIQIEMKPTLKTTWVNPIIAAVPQVRPGVVNPLADSGEEWDGYSQGNIFDTFTSGILEIKGKTTSSSYVKEIRIPVPANAGDTWDIRITLLDNASSQSGTDADGNFTNITRNITWESYQEITSKVYSFPDTVIAKLNASASDTFRQIPKIKGIYDRLLVKVPSNFTAATRTYTGLWDGMDVVDFTNDPAWVIRDLIENPKHGMASVLPVTCDKWSALEASKWFSQQVGGKPRYSFNGEITTALQGKEALRLVAGSVNATILEDGNGTLRIKVDKDDSIVALFQPENVYAGAFTYEFTDLTTRYNDITVSFRNPLLNYKLDRRRVFDQTHINKYGRIPLDFPAIGCTDLTEALRRGHHRLLSATTETTMATFEVNRMGQLVAPYNMILISDPKVETVITGRVLSLDVPRTTLTLRDNVFLEDNIVYTISAQSPNPNYTPGGLGAGPEPTGGIDASSYEEPLLTFTRTITNTNGAQRGSTKTLHVSAAFPADTPEFVTFNIYAAGVLPKAYRVISISESENSPDRMAIHAIEVNRNKYALVDAITAPVEPLVPIATEEKTEPVTLLTVTQNTVLTRTGNAMDLNLEWERSTSRFVSGYNILMSFNGSDLITLAQDLNVTTFPYRDAPPGKYVFYVIAVGMKSRSVPVSVSTDQTAEVRVVAPVTNLALVGGTSAVNYASPDVTFEWGYPSDDPLLRFYRVWVRKSANNAVLRTFTTTDKTFTYLNSHNLTDSAGPATRGLKIEVQVEDVAGNVSTVSALTVNNPLPALPTISTNVTDKNIFLTYLTPTDVDWAGLKIWVGTTTPVAETAQNLISSGRDTNFVLPAAPNTTYYVRYASMDTFNDEYSTPAEVQVATSSASLIDETEYFFDIEISAEETLANQVTWKAGSVHVQVGGTTTTYNTPQNSRTWTIGTTVYVYYVKGESLIRSTTSIATATAVNQRIIATYNGGQNLKTGKGDVLVHGSKILAGTIGANQLSTGLLITDAAQIGNAVIDRASITNTLQSDNYNTTTKQGILLDFLLGKIAANDLKIYDSAGALILDGTTDTRAVIDNAQQAWTDVGGTGKPQDGATVGATVGTDLVSAGGKKFTDNAVINYRDGTDLYTNGSFDNWAETELVGWRTIIGSTPVQLATLEAKEGNTVAKFTDYTQINGKSIPFNANANTAEYIRVTARYKIDTNGSSGNVLLYIGLLGLDSNELTVNSSYPHVPGLLKTVADGWQTVDLQVAVSAFYNTTTVKYLQPIIICQYQRTGQGGSMWVDYIHAFTLPVASDTRLVNNVPSSTVQSRAQTGWDLTQFNSTVLDASSLGPLGLADLDPAQNSKLSGIASGADVALPSIESSTSQGGSLIINSDMTMVAPDGRPAGVKAVYGSATPTNISYQDAGKTILKLYHSSDTSISAGFPAFRLVPGQKYRISVRVKASAVTAGGFYLEAHEFDSELPAGKTHVVVNGVGESGTVNSTRIGQMLVADTALTASFVEFTDLIYTPTGSAKWASIVISNWAQMGTVELHVDNLTVYPYVASVTDLDYAGDLNANYITNTNQLSDGAGWGLNALWSNISGQTNAPADNADATNYADDRVKNSGIQLNADGTMSYWNGSSWVSLGGTNLSGLGFTGDPAATRQVNRGAYAGATTYSKGDVVTSGGSSYEYTNATSSAGNAPPNITYWALLAAQGGTGATGSVGAAGSDGDEIRLAFISSVTQPVTPTGTTFPPTGWVSAPPGGAASIWVTTVKFTAAGVYVGPWSVPTQFANPGTTARSGVISLSLPTTISATTYVQLGSVISLDLGPNGSHTVNYSLNFRSTTANPSTVFAKFQWRPTGGAWADLTVEKSGISSSNAAPAFFADSLVTNFSGAQTAYEFRVMVKHTGIPADLTSVTGKASWTNA